MRVVLKLNAKVRVPRGSSFTIAVSGVLGDAYVSISPPTNPNLEDVLKDGETVVGTRLEGLADLTVKGGDVMDELKMRFKQFVHDVDRGENILVLKTSEGHAIGVAYVIDRLFRDDIVGTLAGQDTIFVTARTVLAATALLEEFTELML